MGFEHLGLCWGRILILACYDALYLSWGLRFYDSNLTSLTTKVIISHTVPTPLCQRKKYFLNFSLCLITSVLLPDSEDSINSRQTGVAMQSVFISRVDPTRTQELKKIFSINCPCQGLKSSYTALCACWRTAKWHIMNTLHNANRNIHA